MLIIQILRIIVVLLLPFFAGISCGKKDVIQSIFFGQTALWAIFEILAVPMIYFRTSFNLLFWCYTSIVFLISVNGMLKVSTIKKERIHFELFVLIAIVVILFQAGMYVVGRHLDEDDARWIAEANDAIVKNKMLLYNPATGEYLGQFLGEMIKDVASPWSMYLAVLARMMGVRPSVVSHTIYAPFLLCISYYVYYLIGKELFKGKSEQGIFLLFIAVIQLFFAGNVYTQSVFSLVRIWQGKAVIASVMIPSFLLIMLQIERDNRSSNWGWMIVFACASCLLSGMGVAISLIMIGVYGGYAVIYKRLKGINLWLVSVAIPIGYGLYYFWLKG